MAIDETLLVPGFRDKVHALLAACREQGVEMRPYFGIRSPFEQAKLWRQSRTREQINQKIADLTVAGAPFLASCIDSVGPQNGEPVTNAIPGLSWHQWGEAIDCVWIVGGKTEWSTQKKVGGINGYAIYAKEARKAGLDPGGFWKSLKDWPHIQLRGSSSPLKIMTLAEIDRAMKEKFGG